MRAINPLNVPPSRIATIRFTPHFLGSTVPPNLNRAAAIIINMAINMWRIPKGKPTDAEVAMCPNAITMPPSKYHHANAEKKPGHESMATVPVGLGIFINAPTTLNAIKIAILAIRLAVKKAFLSSLEVIVYCI